MGPEENAACCPPTSLANPSFVNKHKLMELLAHIPENGITRISANPYEFSISYSTK